MYDWLKAPRCFADENSLVPGSFALSKAEGCHLSRVRRIAEGSPVSVLNGTGQVGIGEVLSVHRDLVEVDIREVLNFSPAQPALTLLIGALKQSAWDELLKHAVELGVNRIIRIQSDHAVSEVQGEKLEKKAVRWGECMAEACKQSGNPWRPALEFADSVETACKEVEEVHSHLFAGMSEISLPLSDVLKDEPDTEICLWVGPEGDFSDREYKQLEKLGAKQVSLGSRILRAETAALALLARLRL